MIRFFLVLRAMAAHLPSPLAPSRFTDDRGQATAEYALVLLGAAAIAGLLIAWAVTGDGGGRIGDLMDRIFDRITDFIA